MSGIMRLDLCVNHQQEKNHSKFDPQNCDFCKLKKEWESLREELLKLGNPMYMVDATESSEVSMIVPQPLFNLDAELNTMAMLGYVMAQNLEILTDDEVARISAWFAGRFGNHKED